MKVIRCITAGVLLTALAGPVAAQVTACGPELGKWVCRTGPTRVMPDVNQILDAGRQGYEDAARITAATNPPRPAQPAMSDHDMLKRQVAHMVETGNCDSAKATALRGGDMDLAEQAARLCVPQP